MAERGSPYYTIEFTPMDDEFSQDLDFHFDWLGQCLRAADALLRASEDGIEAVIVTKWIPDSSYGSLGDRTWTFDFDEDVNSRIVERTPTGGVTTWRSLDAVLARLDEGIFA